MVNTGASNTGASNSDADNGNLGRAQSPFVKDKTSLQGRPFQTAEEKRRKTLEGLVPFRASDHGDPSIASGSIDAQNPYNAGQRALNQSPASTNTDTPQDLPEQTLLLQGRPFQTAEEKRLKTLEDLEHYHNADSGDPSNASGSIDAQNPYNAGQRALNQSPASTNTDTPQDLPEQTLPLQGRPFQTAEEKRLKTLEDLDLFRASDHGDPSIASRSIDAQNPYNAGQRALSQDKASSAHKEHFPEQDNEDPLNPQ